METLSTPHIFKNYLPVFLIMFEKLMMLNNI